MNHDRSGSPACRWRKVAASKQTRWLTLLLCVAGIGVQEVSGQAPLSTGNTVRLTVRGAESPITGVLTSAAPTAWTLESGDGQVVRVAPSDIAGAEVLMVRRRTGRGALIGTGVGVVGGLLIAASADDDCDRDQTGLCDVLVDAGVSGPAMILTPLAGAAVGALVGTFVTSSYWAPALAPRANGATELRWTIPKPGRFARDSTYWRP